MFRRISRSDAVGRHPLPAESVRLILKERAWEAGYRTRRSPASARTASGPAASGGGKSNALQKPLQPSQELAAVVGPGALSRAEGRPKASPAPAPVGTNSRGRKAGGAELTGQIQQILDELSELRGIQTAMQALDAKLDAVLRQVEARGGRDPGDAVPPGVAVQSPAPLSTEDQAVLEKLENEGPSRS